jgi:hypothetical protein
MAPAATNCANGVAISLLELSEADSELVSFFVLILVRNS